MNDPSHVRSGPSTEVPGPPAAKMAGRPPVLSDTRSGHWHFRAAKWSPGSLAPSQAGAGGPRRREAARRPGRRGQLHASTRASALPRGRRRRPGPSPSRGPPPGAAVPVPAATLKLLKRPGPASATMPVPAGAPY